MTVTHVHKDPVALTMAVTAEFDAPAERVWQLWADPRRLERWWGPPGYPATFVDHDLTPGALVTYYMTSPEGDKHCGWWRILSVDAPRGMELEDGFADEHFVPNADMPTMRMHLSIDDRDGGGTRMTITTTFPSLEQMEQLVTMGMEEGLMAAMGQMDDLLTA